MAFSGAILNHVSAAFLPFEPPLNSNRPNCKNRTKNAEKPPKKAVFLRKVVGVRGLEPRASCSQSRRATNCATPRYENCGTARAVSPKAGALPTALHPGMRFWHGCLRASAADTALTRGIQAKILYDTMRAKSSQTLDEPRRLPYNKPMSYCSYHL